MADPLLFKKKMGSAVNLSFSDGPPGASLIVNGRLAGGHITYISCFLLPQTLDRLLVEEKAKERDECQVMEDSLVLHTHFLGSGELMKEMSCGPTLNRQAQKKKKEDLAADPFHL